MAFLAVVYTVVDMETEKIFYLGPDLDTNLLTELGFHSCTSGVGMHSFQLDSCFHRFISVVVDLNR